MRNYTLTGVLLLLLLCTLWCAADQSDAALPSDLTEQPATVLFALLVRNKAHMLPLFLTYLERLDYPKERLALWIRSDHNNDSSVELLQLWLNRTGDLYHSVDVAFDNDTQQYKNESSQFDWTMARFQHLIKLKEAAFAYAEQIWSDYIFYLDADVLLTDPQSLKHLTGLRLPVVAPMLLSESLYSNFWCGMTPDYYYLRTDEYKQIYQHAKVGTFHVPMVHSAVLVHVNYMGSRYLTFDRARLVAQQREHTEWAATQGTQCRPYDGPIDDIIIFAISANCSQIPLFINNELPYGYIMQPLENGNDLTNDLEQLINIRANIVHDLGAVQPVNEEFENFISYPQKTKMTLDHIYMINLERRPERRQKMENLFLELGLDVEYFAAVDGKTLNADLLSEMGIKFLPGYEDPYHHRQMTMGEIGCFLSHYRIWEKIVKNEQHEVLILEDDIRFEPYFKEQAVRVLEQARSVVEYDLIYFGRKRLKEESEPWVTGAESLVHVGYSYWTLGYVISLAGAKKLLAAEPLKKLLPVDEFLPIMFDRHPNKTWSAAFPKRDLLAFSAAPFLLYPTHYTGEEGYISDTEDSELTLQKPQTQSSGTGAQLKSDRELEFAATPTEEQNMPVLDFKDGVQLIKNDLHVGKMHEDL